jgi:hypothetical protein
MNWSLALFCIVIIMISWYLIAVWNDVYKKFVVI